MEKFISEDKKSIILPVALGTTVYEAGSDCSDVCTFQKELTNTYREHIKCDFMAICHTRYRNPDKIVVILGNIGRVLEKWGSRIFETESEAMDFTHKLVKTHIEEIKKLGFKLREDGYSVVENK
jgi:hypothetical protein